MAQLGNKFIQNNAISGSKLRLGSTESVRSRNAGNTADISLIHANSTDQVEIPNTLYMAGNQIKNMLDPVASSDAATKAYVDNVAAGLSPKQSVAAATTAPLPANTYSNGNSGVGATLTGNSNGALAAVDGYVPVQGDRILVMNEAAAANNGIYVVTQSGTSGTPYILTRSLDADSPSDLKGAYTFALNGVTQTDNEFILTIASAITVGSTSLVFSNYGNSTTQAGNGISKSGAVLSANLGVGLTFSGSQIIAQTQGPGTLNTTGIDTQGNIKALRQVKSVFTLGAQDITNQYVDLSIVASTGSVQVIPTGGIVQHENADYVLNYTGGTSSKTRVSFIGDIGSGGGAALVVGDILNISCLTL